MIHPEVAIIPFVFAIPAGVIVIRGWFKQRERMATLQQAPPPALALDVQLARLEEAVDAVAVELERQGEGQRFVTRLLSERTPPPPDQGALPHGRVVTPH